MVTTLTNFSLALLFYRDNAALLYDILTNEFDFLLALVLFFPAHFREQQLEPVLDGVFSPPL